MTFIVLDKASNNVLGEYDVYEEADAFRIQTVGYSPDLTEHVVVVDLDELMAAPEAAPREAPAVA